MSFNADTSFNTSDSYQENGYQITSDFTDWGKFIFWGNDAPYSAYNANPGGNTLVNNAFFGGSQVTMTFSKIGGGAFNIGSIDLGNAVNGQNYPGYYPPSDFAGNVVFQFTHVGGQVDDKTITVGSEGGLKTIIFNELNLAQFTWTASTPSFSTAQIDNITATPIPGAVWLFGSALAGVLGFKRKRA